MIIEKYNGKINFISTFKVGSTFWFEFYVENNNKEEK
jgi:hypothetical protein